MPIGPTTPRTRTRWRRAGLAGAAALAVAMAPLSAISASPVTQTEQTPPIASASNEPGTSRVVTLVTGDRVRLTEYEGGRSTAAMLPGSPSYGEPVQLMHSPDHTYVIPDLGVAARKRLDYSMFDVTALQGRSSGSVAVRVRFREGATPHDVSGLDVDESSARSDGAATVADATYEPGVSADPEQWSGVDSVRLASTPRPSSSRDVEMRTLTIKAKAPDGGPAPFVDAYVQNASDTRLFLFPVAVENGVGKVSVPEGDYSVLGLGFSRSGEWLNVEPEVEVDGDTTITLRAKRATVRPRVSVAGAQVDERGLNLLRTSERRGSVSLSLGGFVPRLQPVPAKLPHGEFRTFLDTTSTTMKAKARRIYTKDAWKGVPKRIVVRHRRSEFARVPQNFHALGGGVLWSGAYGFAKGETSGWVSEYRTKTPSRRSAWFQAGSVRWLQSASVSRGPREAVISDIRRYKRGRAPAEHLLRSPVGPGLERRNDAAGTGPACLLCRDGNALRGRLPMWNSAGGDERGEMWSGSMGSWTLRGGGKALDQGRFLIAPKVTLPAKRQAYTLSATSTPGFGPHQLSSRVSTSWGFTSSKGKAVIPLLTPSYVPPADLRGRTKPGKIRYRLNLDNLGPAESRVKKASVRYSTSGGKKWRKAQVRRIDKNSFRVQYRNPAAAGKRRYVSLQVAAKDAAGRTVRETAIRAYRLTRANKPAPADTSPPVADTDVSAASAVSVRMTSDRSVPRRDPGQAEGGKRACKAPGPRAYRCFALIERSGRDALTRAGDPAGWGATDLRDAYGVPANPKPGQKIAVVVAYDYPKAAADMNKYRRQYGLPLCKIKTGCFKKINQDGKQGDYPKPNRGWAMEAALDLQMISAACPKCKIVLAEADNPSVASMGKAVDAAVDAGAVVTNHSYGLYEYGGVKKANRKYARKGVTAVAASGDYGFEPASFPAGSSDVLAVGGTVLHHATNERGWRENAWKYAGSGCSAYFSGPAGQDDPACDMRTVADVSAVSDGLAVYNSFSGGPKRRWWVIGGTSASSPFVAGMIAAAKAGGIKPGEVYASPDAYFDVRKGSNGFCKRSYLCTAKPGYDGPTGLGTPRGLATFGTD